MFARLTRSRLVRKARSRLRPLYRRINPWTGLGGLDRKVVPFLPRGRGFFVEAGANDGLRYSNTHYLEARRGWNGLLIEAIPEMAERCQGNRRRSKVVSAALVEPAMDGQKVDLVDVDLMSFVPGSRGSPQQDESHLVAGEQLQGVRRRVITVTGRSLSAILDEMDAPEIDFLSLDLEGYEEQALQGLDLSRHAPTWILVESENCEVIGKTLGDGYELVSQVAHRDWLFHRVGAP